MTSSLVCAFNFPFSPKHFTVSGRTGSTRKKGKIPTAYIAACVSALGLILLKILAAKTIFLSTLALLLAAVQFFKHSGGGHSGKITGTATTIDGGKNIEITSAAKRRNSDCATLVTHYNQGDALSTLGDANLEVIGQLPLTTQVMSSNYDFNRRNVPNVNQRADYEVFPFMPENGQGTNPYLNQPITYGNQVASKQFGPNDYYRQNDAQYVINSEPLSANAIVLNEHVHKRQEDADRKEEYVDRGNKNPDRRKDSEIEEEAETERDDEDRRKAPRNDHKNDIDNIVDNLREKYHSSWKTLDK